MLFNLLKENLASTPEIVSKVRAIFSWNITKSGKTVAKWSKWCATLCVRLVVVPVCRTLRVTSCCTGVPHSACD